MENDDAAARAAQATRWRQQIERLTERGQRESPEPSPPAADSDTISPREFIHRKMAELDSESPDSSS